MKARQVIELCIGSLLTLLLCVIAYVFVKSPPKNFYTRVATVELMIAIGCRFAVGGYYQIHSLEHKNNHLYDYRFQIPFYMIIKV